MGAVQSAHVGRRRPDWPVVVMLVVGLALVAFAVGRCWYLVSSQWEQEQANEQAIARSSAVIGNWPSAKQREVLEAVRGYNDSVDPRTHDMDDDHAKDDKAYEGLLDTDGTGIIGSIYIPSISARLPFRHGTGDAVLESGAGHMWGTDIPVGDKGDFTAIAGHSGSVHGLFFTRVPELRKGDLFYVSVLGKETGYRIDTIKEVMPDDVDALRAMYRPDGRARVTLITCTPVGVNTYRLLVSGESTGDIPPSRDAPGDAIWPWGVALWAMLAGLVVVSVLVLRWAVRRRRRRTVGSRHARIPAVGGRTYINESYLQRTAEGEPETGPDKEAGHDEEGHTLAQRNLFHSPR